MNLCTGAASFNTRGNKIHILCFVMFTSIPYLSYLLKTHNAPQGAVILLNSKKSSRSGQRFMKLVSH